MRRIYDTPECFIVRPRMNSLLEGIDLTIGSGDYDGEAAAKQQPTAQKKDDENEENEETEETLIEIPHYKIWDD